jgi:5-formyltetrahydrofolate cyclo-ligase
VSASALEARKRALRAELRALPVRDREVESRRCLDGLLALPALAGPGTLALFASLPDEVPVERAWPDLRARGWRVAFPRIERGEPCLCEAAPHELVPGRSGLREPPPGAPRIEVAQIDVFAVPGLLFTPDGTRLGRGAGHYDRMLARARPDALRIGICYSDRVRDALPSAPHDVPVHLLVTDRAVHRCRAPADAEGIR